MLGATSKGSVEISACLYSPASGGVEEAQRHCLHSSTCQMTRELQILAEAPSKLIIVPKKSLALHDELVHQ